MRRGEIWWAVLPEPTGRRPVLLLSRNEAYAVRELVTIAPVTTRIRDLPSEIRLGTAERLPRSCVANLDVITTIPRKCLRERISALTATKARELDEAILFALGLRP